MEEPSSHLFSPSEKSRAVARLLPDWMIPWGASVVTAHVSLALDCPHPRWILQKRASPICLDSHMALGLLLLQTVGPEGHPDTPDTPGLRGRDAGLSLAGAAVLVSTVLRCPPAAPLLNFSPGKPAPPGPFRSADRSRAQVSSGICRLGDPNHPIIETPDPSRYQNSFGQRRSHTHQPGLQPTPLQGCLPSECHALSISPCGQVPAQQAQLGDLG